MDKNWDDTSLKPVDLLAKDLDRYASETRKWQGIPGICWAGGERLLATWYSGGNTEGPENYVIVACSNNAGKDWTDPIAVIDPPDNVRAFDSTIWRDPRGRVWLFWAQGWSPEDQKIWDGRAGVWCSICENPQEQELTWSPPRRISDGIMLNKPWVCRDGRWILPVSIWNLEPFHPSTEGRRLAGIVVSKDQGKTFEWMGGAKIPQNVFDEHVIFDRSDDSLVLWSRTTSGMAESISHDKGRTWSEGYKNDLDCPNSRFCIARTKDGELLLINHVHPRMDEFSIYNGTKGAYGRNNLTALLSCDEGSNWHASGLIDPRQGVSYPDTDISDDGRIAVIYDFNRFQEGEILLTVFTKEDLLTDNEIFHTTISLLSH